MKLIKILEHIAKRISAIFRIRLKDVCEMSKGMGLVDYHDYHDTKEKQPWHFCELKCERCGKKFSI